MAVSVAVLASGSRGNSTLLSSAKTHILVDAGLSCREICKRMKAVGFTPDCLSAVLITHEHVDHIAGLRVLARKLSVPVFITSATHRTWARAQQDETGEVPEIRKLEVFASGHKFQVGDIEITPFTIPHDAIDPVGFAFRVEGVKVAIATDLGYLPASVLDHLRGCEVLVIESNHDLEMLRGGPYPWSIKQRVMSRVGHLSNEALADFFLRDYDGNAAYVVLAHLSEQNNHPEVARRAAEHALASRRTLLSNRVLLATQDQPLEPIRP
jgi:phosphoribosyl 1,2-cyclic phosphodiesterase